MTEFEQQEIQDMIDASIKEAMRKHNRNASLISAFLGMTVFEDGTEVKSVANRMVVFPSRTRHTGTTCTDAKRRVVLNFNFFPERFPDAQRDL